jgi:hypothetical protein
VAALAAVALSYAQRSLSAPARRIRRRVRAVDGTITLLDGTIEVVDSHTLLAPLERALRALSWSTVLLATALTITRLT